MSFDALKQAVEAALPTYIPQPEGYAADLYAAMRYSLLSPGKRLRPCLCLFAAQLCGADSSEVMPFACALEMIHAYSLIHDDLPAMDNDDLRRGRPTCHKVYGEANAILAGDGLLSIAFETMLQAAMQGGNQARKVCALEYIARCAGSRGMVAGQAADMEGKGQSPELLLYIQENKTARMIMASVVSGAILGGADERLLHDLETYAYNIGIAFQVTDDILDETGDESVFGKPIKSDEKNGKLTAVALFGLDGASRLAREHVARAHQALAGRAATQELAVLADSLLTRKK